MWERESWLGSGDEWLLTSRSLREAPISWAGVATSSDSAASFIWLASGALFTLMVRPAKFALWFVLVGVSLVEPELSPSVF